MHFLESVTDFWPDFISWIETLPEGMTITCFKKSLTEVAVPVLSLEI